MHLRQRHVDVFAFVSGIGMDVRGPSLDASDAKLLVASQPDEGHVLDAVIAKPRLAAEYAALQVWIAKAGGRFRVLLVLLLRPAGGPTQDIRSLLQQHFLRYAATAANMAQVHRLFIDQRLVLAVPQAGGCILRRKPISEELSRDLELERRRAYAPELARNIGFVRQQFLEHLAPPVKPIRVALRVRPFVHQTVRRQTPPLTLAGVLVRLELDEEERYAVVRLHTVLALGSEPIGFRVFAGRVVEHNDIATFLAKKAVLKQSEQEHPA